jgi:hypothetical protein
MNIFKTSLRSGKASYVLMCLSVMAVTQSNAQQWNPVGPSTGISGGAASFQNLVKDASGNLYSSFYDVAVSKGSVMKYNGTSWTYLGGTAGITTGIATYNSLAVAGNGDVFYCNQAGTSGINVRKFNGTAWTSLPDAETATSNYQAMVTDASNKPVIAYSSGNSAKVKRYDGTNWNVLGTGLPAGVPNYIDIVIGSNDSVYVSWVGGTGMVVYKIHVNASATDTWTELGTTGFAATSSEQYRSAMAIDASNNIYVAFTSPSSAGNKINVKKYTSGQWSDVGSSNFSANRVHYVSIAISPSGMPYVAYSHFENNPNYKNYVMRYNNGQWEAVGGTVSDGEAKWNALNFDNSGNPVLAYSDAGISGGGNMVKKFTSATTCTNTLPGTTVGSIGCVTFNYKGQNVTYSTVRAADGYVWLQQNLGATTVATSKTDTAAYGDYFQWGRWDDGHQNKSASTGAVPAVNNPAGLSTGSGTFFTGTGSGAWWNGGPLTDTWAANTVSNATTTNGVDPCKAIGPNWHLPTQAEWVTVVADELITNPDLAFSSNLKLTIAGSRSSSSGNFDFVGVRGYYWSTTTSSTGAKYYYFSAAVNNTGAGNTRGGGASVRCLNTTANVTVVDSVDVTTQNNVAAVINTNGGTLQMQAAVLPAINNQSVTWSVVSGTGTATISATGLVTATANGTVWAKAVSVTDVTKMDSLQITISNQVVAVTSIDVTTQNNVVATITTNGGNLQMVSTILPSNAVQSVTWSIVSGTGTATISATGLVTATANGTVWAKAVSVADVTKMDSLQITISNQVVAVTSIDVTTQNNVVATIITNGGNLQMVSTILPSNAVQAVTWSIVPGTGTATISAAGLVTATTNGTVWGKAVSVADASKIDSLQITISNQVVAITSIHVATLNNAPAAITANGGSLQMQATILPSNAVQTVTWSIVQGTGTATISATGLVTATTNGTVWAKAVSVADVTKTDSLKVNLSGQGTSTAIVDIKETYGLQAYPNPVQETLIIQSTQSHPVLNVDVTDVYGRVVIHLKVNANGLLMPHKINMGKLSEGIYILTISDEQGAFVKKIIKQ